MGLIIDLEKKEFWIDGSNPVFEDTDYQGIGFSFLVSPLNRIQVAQIRKQHTKTKRGGREVSRDEEIEIDMFMRQVIDWKGIEGTDGKPIPCNETMKRQMAEEMFFLASLVNLACLNVRKRSEEQKEEEGKNSRKPGGGK